MTDTPYTNASDDAPLWDDIGLCAGPLGIAPSTFAQWKSRGYVPPSMHYDLVQIAHEIGVALTSRALHEQWKRARAARGHGDPPQY